MHTIASIPWGCDRRMQCKRGVACVIDAWYVFSWRDLGFGLQYNTFQLIVRMKQNLDVHWAHILHVIHPWCVCVCCPNGFSCVSLCWLAIYWVPLLDNGLESLLLAIILAIEATTKAKSLMSPFFLSVLLFACYVICRLGRFMSSCKTWGVEACFINTYFENVGSCKTWV